MTLPAISDYRSTAPSGRDREQTQCPAFGSCVYEAFQSLRPFCLDADRIRSVPIILNVSTESFGSRFEIILRSRSKDFAARPQLLLGGIECGGQGAAIRYRR